MIEVYATLAKTSPFGLPPFLWACGRFWVKTPIGTLLKGRELGAKGGIAKVGTPRGSDFWGCLPSSRASFDIKIWKYT